MGSREWSFFFQTGATFLVTSQIGIEHVHKPTGITTTATTIIKTASKIKALAVSF